MSRRIVVYLSLFCLLLSLGTNSFAMKKVRLSSSSRTSRGLLLSASQISPQEKDVMYVIEDRFDLGGKKLTVPQGCVLSFAGGTLENGTLEAAGATIDAPLSRIFATDLKLAGKWTIDKLPVEWYGAIGDDTFDSTEAINAAINNTTVPVVSLLADRQYVVSKAIRMRSSDFSFGCFETSYTHENCPSAQIYSNCTENILEFPKGVNVQGVQLRGLLLRKRWRYNYKGDGIHIEDAAFMRCAMEGVRIYYCNHGFYQHFGAGYKGYSLNKVTNCVFSGCRYGFTLTHDTGGKHSFWCNLNSWDNCHFGFNLQYGLEINNVYSCEQNLFSSCGFEGVSMDENQEWKGDYDITSVRMRGQGYGVSTFYNCYFERNHPKNTTVKASASRNEQTDYCVSDVIIEGAMVEFQNSTFNEGITPIVIKDGYVGVNIVDCVFRNEYDSNCIVLFKGVKQSNLQAGNYFSFKAPFIDKKYVSSVAKAVGCNLRSLPSKIEYVTVR